VARSLRTERMLATLSGGFAAIALLLSVVGLYGVMAFVVTSRTQEIGVRMALGATRGRAVWLVVADAVAMIAAGTALALPCVWAVGRVVEAQLFGVQALDAPTIAGASALLALVALAAAMLPAWRAASVSPTEALRFE
jgi:putative ABC transport system permease protein